MNSRDREKYPTTPSPTYAETSYKYREAAASLSGQTQIPKYINESAPCVPCCEPHTVQIMDRLQSMRQVVGVLEERTGRLAERLTGPIGNPPSLLAKEASPAEGVMGAMKSMINGIDDVLGQIDRNLGRIETL